MFIDLHVHSAVSDGTDTIPQLIAVAQSTRLDCFALTDHDTMAGVNEAQALGSRVHVTVLRGIEISTHFPHGNSMAETHLLAYGCRPSDTALVEQLRQIREARKQRIPMILSKLADLGMLLDLAEVQAHASAASSIGRPHVADAMVAKGYVSSRDDAFRDYLYHGGPAYVEKSTPTIFEALDIVNNAGGVPVLAHPWSRDNARVMTADVVADLAAHHGLLGLEVDHADHSPEMREELRRIADQLGLIITGSSDYHGRGKIGYPLGVYGTDPSAFHTIVATIEERQGSL